MPSPASCCLSNETRSSAAGKLTVFVFLSLGPIIPTAIKRVVGLTGPLHPVLLLVGIAD